MRPTAGQHNIIVVGKDHLFKKKKLRQLNKIPCSDFFGFSYIIFYFCREKNRR